MEQQINTAPQKKISPLACVGVFLGAGILLYRLGLCLIQNTDLEYRLWVSVLGDGLIFVAVPLWCICVLRKFLVKREVRRWLVRLVTAILVVLFLAWGGIYFLVVIFSVPEEYRLFERYLAVDVGYGFLAPSEWTTYEAVGLFFRCPCDAKEVEHRYLEKTYGEQFTYGEVTEEMANYIVYNTRSSSKAWFSESHPEVPVFVLFNGKKMSDSYATAVQKYAREKTGGGNKGVEAEEARREEEELERLREEAVKAAEEASQTAANSDEVRTREAQKIYESLIGAQGIGTDFTVCYNAKGVPYYDLGDDGEFAYALVYDRFSANKACRLYVLYQLPQNEAGNRYVDYTEQGARIKNIYAYVIETDEIIASGRQAWSDVGNEEYRAAAGE